MAYHPSFKNFFGNDPAILTDVAENCTYRRFEKGEPIVVQGDAGDDALYILKGQARAYLSKADGREIWLDDFVPGALFGEMALLVAMRRSCNVMAVSRVEVAIFTQEQFLALMHRHGSIGLALSRLLALRIRSTTQRMFAVSAENVDGRVVAELLSLARPAEAGEGRLIISPAPTITKLSQRISASRETVSRFVNQAIKEGLVEKRQKSWFIPDPDGLMSFGSE